MKKRIALVFLTTILIFTLASCTPFWKPTEEELLMMEQTLGAANAAEAALFATMDALCTSGTIPADKCSDGYALDKEWQLNYQLAMTAISDYRAGVGGIEMISKYYPQAIASGIRTIALIKDLIASKPATAKMLNSGMQKFERTLKRAESQK